MNKSILAELRQALGPERVSTAPEDLAAYAYDGTWAETRPDVVVHPQETAHVVAVLRIADAARVPVVPRGSATGLAGGAVPVVGSICLNLARMNRILEISVPDTCAVVQPGVITQDLQRAVEKFGFFYPPDPASVYQCTVGGNVATNAGGPRCLKYGVTGDYVLGLEVVLAGGHVLRLGGRTIKDVAGYDLKRLFIGSEGTLGVVTEVTVRLIPKPAAQLTALAAFPRLADACEAVGNILQAGIVPLVTELMDQGTTRAIEDFKHLGLPTDVEALLLVAVDGDADLVQREIAVVADVLKRSGARDLRHARTAEESEALWEARRNVSPAIARLARNKLGEDIAVPRSRIPEMVAPAGGDRPCPRPAHHCLRPHRRRQPAPDHPVRQARRGDDETRRESRRGGAGGSREPGRHAHRRARHRHLQAGTRAAGHRRPGVGLDGRRQSAVRPE